MRYRKLPTKVDAVQWTDGSVRDVVALVGPENFERITDLATEATARVYDRLHSTWVLVHTGDWIIRGIQGETYSCRPDVFADTYEPVDQLIRYVDPATATMAGPGPRSTAAPLDDATIKAMPEPKWYACPVCHHDTAVHRMGGCDVRGCECSAPHGRILPGDPAPDASTPPER